MSVDFESDEILAKDRIIARLAVLFPSIEEVERLLKNPLIAPPSFLPTMNKMAETGELEKTHSETVTWLYELLDGDRLLHSKKVKDKELGRDKPTYRFLAELFCAVVKENPARKDELNEALEKRSLVWADYTIPWGNKDVSLAEHLKIPESSLPLNYSNVDHVEKVFNFCLTGTKASAAQSVPFLGNLCDIMNLPEICAQKQKNPPNVKTIDVEPTGNLNPLYDYQRDVSRQIEKMLTTFSFDNFRALISLPTGSGKTRVVVESIIEWMNDGLKMTDRDDNPQQKKFILWVVDKRELCQQAFETFESIFRAMGGKDTSLRLNVFWGNKSKDLEQLMDDSKSARASVIVATIGSFNSIIDQDSVNEKADQIIPRLVKRLGLVVVDEAHHATTESWTKFLNGIGFNFRTKPPNHSSDARLLGLTATPMRHEKAEMNLGKEDGSGRRIKSQTETLQSRFGKSDGTPNFFWPDIENSSLSEQKNYPHPILEVQQTAQLGRDVKLMAEKSYDQDGKISDYYWQITKRQVVSDRTKDPYRYDSGRDCFGLKDNEPSENLAKWKKKDWNGETQETKNKWVGDKIFDTVGTYQIKLWVKDDEGLVSQDADIRRIEIKTPPKTTLVDNQEKMKQIEESLIKDRVLSRPLRWNIKHDSLEWAKQEGIEIKRKKLLGRETGELDDETEQQLLQDPTLNQKIISVVKKLINEEGKKSILLFVGTVAHAKFISCALRSVLRINSQYVHGGTHTSERCRFINDFRNKKIQILCNVDILTTGFDAPEVDAVIVARVNQTSYPLWVQMVGRGLRGTKNGGTEFCRIVDFASKIKEETAQYTEEEQLASQRFHSSLFEEDVDLKWEDGKFYQQSKDSGGSESDEDSGDNRRWEYGSKPKTAEELFSYINTKLDPHKLDKNYRLVMIRYLLSEGRLSRDEVANYLYLANKNAGKGLEFYRYVPAYDALRKPGIILGSSEGYEINATVSGEMKQSMIQHLDLLIAEFIRIKEPVSAAINDEYFEQHIEESTPQTWLYAVTEKNWEIVKTKNIWGASLESRTKKLKRDDKIIFYVKKTGLIRGIFESASDWYESKSITWDEEIQEGRILYPYQIKLKKGLIADVSYNQIKDQLDFVDDKEHYPMYLQMHTSGPSNFGRPINSHDFELIKDQMEIQGSYQ